MFSAEPQEQALSGTSVSVLTHNPSPCKRWGMWPEEGSSTLLLSALVPAMGSPKAAAARKERIVSRAPLSPSPLCPRPVLELSSGQWFRRGA